MGEAQSTSRGGSFRELLSFRACGADDLSMHASECLVSTAQDRPSIDKFGMLAPLTGDYASAVMPPAPWLQADEQDAAVSTFPGVQNQTVAQAQPSQPAR